MMKKPVVLTIMDGFGCTDNIVGNAIVSAGTPNLDALTDKYPHTHIFASGLDVGLPEGQMGNSEVGHTNIGAGRIIYQDLTRISKAIEDGEFFENIELKHAMKNARHNKLHIMGLLSDGGVHSHINHLKAVLDMAKRESVEQVFVHAFTDGRDTDPQSAIDFVKDMQSYMNRIGVGKFASVCGRYYAMDRDKRWDRVEQAYNALVKGEGNHAESALSCVEESYKKGINDEFIEPTVMVENDEAIGKIEENDSVIFFNFRPDRAREITRSIVDKNFDGFIRTNMESVFVCMTTYDVTIEEVSVAFGPQDIENTLGEYLSNNGKNQLRAAETEKYAHVTFFFNGGKEEPYKNEDRLLIPSPKVATYDLQPEMSAYELLEKLLKAIDEDKYDFIAVNFANPDMVGHTGNVEATEKAIRTVDECVGKLFEKILSIGGSGIITADHGNAEYMIDYDNGRPVTSHSTNPVPILVVGEEFVGKELLENGRLCDLAPTVLSMMKMEKPVEMAGHSLIVG
ncbi:2,3-bisphosphoglycerate-independent phosphoglycerate mutase [Peptostreptococcus equinus]|uniref:2,3-bisphosphoglycerate-independent phosphoglycerate mutase n=2 Tax=Peptostreptococcus equinus TaxID=3003601 RepID=A0ABY7JV55_9FIRM|nr:2,3-bisphosphoglycerate-independent phosphoglycerate mutase [Peptostreptococcus sp. CBA3647]WAW15870.1 2,3-bisphosphoglycerate-independent phosphoglycerate mutase [Peptostreptococcus sp. CBA3647]